MKTLNCLLCLIVAISTVQAEPAKPLFPNAQVVLSLEDARDLLSLEKDSAKNLEKEPPPPIGASIQSAQFQISFAPRQASGELQVTSFRKGWQLIPLFHSSLPLVTMDAGGGSLVQNDGMICLLTDKPGPTSVKVGFALSDEARKFSFRCAPALSSRLQIGQIPDGKRLQYTRDQKEFTAQGGEIEAELIDDQPMIPTQWAVTGGGALVNEADGELIYTLRFSLQGEKGSGSEADFIIPQGADRIEATGTDLNAARTRITSGKEKRLHLEWQTAGVLSREIQIAYRIPQNSLETAWLLETPSLLGDAAPKIPFVAIPQTKIELLNPQGELLAQSAKLPRWMRADATNRIFTGEIQGLLSLTVRALPQLESETTSVREANYETRLTADGSLLCELVLELEHRGATAWHFQLPERSELLNCEVSGRSANPIIRHTKSLELDVPANNGNASRIKLTYTAKLDKFDPLKGRVELLLPVTPLFIYQLNWKIALPAAYGVSAIEGNVASKAGNEPGKLQLEKQLIRGEQPQLEIFYAKQEANR